MQVVIDIAEKDYQLTKDGHIPFNVLDVLMNGTPLPKRHERLIDADKLTREIKGYIRDTSNLHYDALEEAEAYNSAYYNCLDEIEDASTIIEADKEEE